MKEAKSIVKSWLIVIPVLAVSISEAYAVGITIPLSSTFNLNTGTLNVAGDVTNAGTLQLSTGSITLTGNWTNSGTFTSGTGTVDFTAGSGTQTVTCGGITDSEDFYDITHSGAGTLQLQDAMVIKHDLINSAGTWDANSQDTTIYEDFNNSATFTHNNNTVTFRGTAQSDITGTNTFYNLTVDTNTDGAKTVRFGAGETQTVANTLMLTGYLGKVLTIQSTSAGTQANLTLQAGGTQQDMYYLDVKDNNASGGQTLHADTNSTDSLNNTNWTFGNYIEIALLDRSGTDYLTWAVGQVATSSVKTMVANSGAAGDEGIQVDNASNTSVDIESYASNTASWTLGTSVGTDQCVLETKAFTAWEPNTGPDMTGAVTVTATASPGTDIQTVLAAYTDTYLYYRLTAPSEVTSGNQNTITVTVEATIP